MTFPKTRNVYRYYFLPEDENDKEEPLIYCPICNDDLTVAQSVVCFLTPIQKPGCESYPYLTRLDCGVLQDTPTLSVLKDGKVDVRCNSCKTSLAELDEVYEEELVI